MNDALVNVENVPEERQMIHQWRKWRPTKSGSPKVWRG